MGSGGNGFLDHLKSKSRKKKMMNKLLAPPVVMLFAFGCSNQKDRIKELGSSAEEQQVTIHWLQSENTRLTNENKELEEANGKLKTDIIKFATDLKPRLIEFAVENKRLQSEITKLKEGGEGEENVLEDDDPTPVKPAKKKKGFDGRQPKGGGPDVENPNRPKKKE